MKNIAVYLFIGCFLSLSTQQSIAATSFWSKWAKKNEARRSAAKNKKNKTNKTKKNKNNRTNKTKKNSANGCGDQTQFNCMVATINGEARGEPYEGMLVVGKTLKTRMLRGYIGKSICGISKRSFAPRSVNSTKTKGKALARVIKAAKASCASKDNGVTHFHSYKNKFDRRAPWARSFKYAGKVGGHWLFKAPSSTKANFDNFVAFEEINNHNFFSDADVHFYYMEDQEILDSYTPEDDKDVEAILAAPIVDSISI